MLVDAGAQRRSAGLRQPGLKADEKERAEHIMLVDLGRNDVGRVSQPGTVEVTDLMRVVRYSHVMHLESEVQGRLREDRTIYDALRSCLPAGTLSGAPKIRAMEIISEQEGERRGPYGGAVGYFSFSGNMDTAITIRTMVIKDGVAYIQAGGGVVADSVPESEYQETLHKARSSLRAIEEAERSGLLVHCDSLISGRIRKMTMQTVRGMFTALEVPNYRLLFAGRITSNSGRTMRVFARAIWVFEATGSPLRMGIAVSALSWPMLFMPLIGGIVADRVDRKKLLLWTEGLLVILWAVVALFISLGSFQWWYFIITAVASGTIQSFGRAGHQAMIGSVVDEQRLGNAVALDSISMTWPRIAAPALGGLLIGPIGVDGLFWVTAAGQAFTFITLIFIRWTPQERRAARDSVRGNVMEALQHIRGEKVIMSLVMLGLFSSLFAGSFNFLLPIFAIDILRVGDLGLGVLMTTSALGGAVGSIIVLAASNARRHRGLLLMVMAAVKAVMLIIFSQSNLFPVSLVAMFGLGGAQVIFMTMITMAMQQLAPDHLRGRIMSLRVVIMGFSPFGVIIMGAIAEVRGAADTVLIGGILYGVTALAVFALAGTLRRFQ